MLIQQYLVSIRETNFARRKLDTLGGGEVVEGVFVELCEAGAQIAADEVFPTLELGLNYDEGEVCLRIHVAGHFFDFFDLALNFLVYAVD